MKWDNGEEEGVNVSHLWLPARMPMLLYCLVTDQLRQLWPFFMWPNIMWLGVSFAQLCWVSWEHYAGEALVNVQSWFLEVSPYFPLYSGLLGRSAGQRLPLKLELPLLTPESGSRASLPPTLPKVWMLGFSEPVCISESGFSQRSLIQDTTSCPQTNEELSCLSTVLEQ